MPSDSPTPFDNPPRPDSEDAAEKLPSDPGKTWVPEERDAPILAETQDMPAPPEETQPFSAGSVNSASKSSQSSVTSAEADEPPRLFGEYELLEEIGRGGMGMVYKARDGRLDRIVALKTLKVRSLKTEQQVERFVREAKAAARLDHPHIVPCYDSGEHDGWHYLTMAYVAGQSLQDRLEDGPLEPAEAAKLVHALAGAVAHAHHQGVVHRDIKPSNVLLDKDGRPRLTDFGIAKLLDGDLFTASPQLTLVGQVLGTPGYMAPEQSAGRRWEVGQSADIYALGGVLNAALTGEAPGSGDTLPLHIPAELHAICNRCLAHRPQDRYDSADDVVSALDQFLKGLHSPAPPVASPRTEPETKAGETAFKLSRTGLIKATGFVVAVIVCSLLLGTWLAGWWGQSDSAEGQTNPPPQGTSPNGNNPSDQPAASGLIQSRLDVLVKRGEKYVPLVNALPLESEDQLEVDVRADRMENAFLYLVRIDTTQRATLENAGRPIPLSPAVPSPDSDLPKVDFAVKAVATESLIMDRSGPAGILTLILLSRKEPLSDAARNELNRAFQSLIFQEPVLEPGSIARVSGPNPEPSPRQSPIDLQPFIDRQTSTSLLEFRIKGLRHFYDWMEYVQFHVPEYPVPAVAQPARNRTGQP